MAKQLAILCADVSGSTRLFRTLGQEEAKRQIDRCIKRMERSIESFNGQVINSAADQMMATFMLADDAILGAIDMQHRLADLPPVSGVRLSIRISVHYGVTPEHEHLQNGRLADVGKSLLNLAGQNQIVTCDMTAAALSKPVREILLPLRDMLLSTPYGDAQLFEVKDQQGQSVARPSTVSRIKPASSPERLFVRLNGTAYVVDNTAPRMSFGRDKQVSVVLNGSKVSRRHAVIEKRGHGGFFLKDTSTNGSYLNIDGVGETCVQQAEVVITGNGKIGFGHSTEVIGDVVEIELV